MTQIERAIAFVSTPRSVLDRIPVLGKKRTRRRVERGEDPLSLLVIAKLMGHLATNGFTVTYIMDREMLVGDSLDDMRHVTDSRNTTQEQEVILRGKDEKLYRVGLKSSQTKEGNNISRNSLSLTVEDHVEEGPQRFLAIYKDQDKPSFFNRKQKEYAGKYFYGVNVKNWKFDSWFNLENGEYLIFLEGILGASVDTKLTQDAFEKFELELKAQNTPRSGAILSVLWNRAADGLLD